MKVWIVKRESFYGETKILLAFTSLNEAKKCLGKIKRDCIMTGRKTRNFRGKQIGFYVYYDDVYQETIRNSYSVYIEEEGIEVQ